MLTVILQYIGLYSLSHKVYFSAKVTTYFRSLYLFAGLSLLLVLGHLKRLKVTLSHILHNSGVVLNVSKDATWRYSATWATLGAYRFFLLSRSLTLPAGPPRAAGII